MKTKKTAPKRAGTTNPDPAVGFSRLLDSIGDDPVKMIAAIALMDGLILQSRPRRAKKKSTQ